MQLDSETIKGLWGVIAIVIGAFCTWVGWTIKALIDKKQKAAEKKTALEIDQENLHQKIDNLIDLQTETAKLQERRMDIITEGLDISLSSSEVILEGLHESKLVNGPSEIQRKNIKDFKNKLFHLGLEKPQEDFNPVQALQNFKEKDTKK